ncbi:hypothetical protein EHW97_11965 [Aeromicrobium camelliae]|uniref:Uncharacterized protein n=1 Tax=Aeromicrobium camelliae TaxID=1538144 RepID=A0A3N6YY98_9ACTN|nr:hypothetical protein [Aeromicrobium camelliae]RQN02751.1 hypothetical protein EHW97_11965 [Aeromicrobium camelliae]
MTQRVPSTDSGKTVTNFRRGNAMSEVSRPVALLQRGALITACIAAVPYVVLKVLWLSGSTVGITSAAAAFEMSSTRVVAANVTTVLLLLVAIVFVTALTRPWGQRVPGAVVLVLAAGATGLLAPFLLGLPIGMVVQLLSGPGASRPEVQPGLAPWVFSVVYGGFGVFAVALAVLSAVYVVQRWPELTADVPTPSPWTTVVGVIGLVPFSAAMLFWGLSGPGSTGPQGMDSPAQRTVLVVNGALSAAALILQATAAARRHPHIAWLVIWTGTCVAALQGPSHVLLARDGQIEPLVAVIAVLSASGATAYGLGILRHRWKRMASQRALTAR